MNQATCSYCYSKDRLELCNKCGRWVCPKHRAGFGDLSLGYFCVGRPCVGVALAPIADGPAPQTYWLIRITKGPWLFLIAIVVGALIGVLYPPTLR